MENKLSLFEFKVRGIFEPINTVQTQSYYVFGKNYPDAMDQFAKSHPKIRTLSIEVIFAASANHVINSSALTEFLAENGGGN